MDCCPHAREIFSNGHRARLVYLVLCFHPFPFCPRGDCIVRMVRTRVRKGGVRGAVTKRTQPVWNTANSSRSSRSSRTPQLRWSLPSSRKWCSGVSMGAGLSWLRMRLTSCGLLLPVVLWCSLVLSDAFDSHECSGRAWGKVCGNRATCCFQNG